MRVDGGCHCGRVTYEADISPQDVGICHCTDCQRLTGSAFRVTAATSRSNFRITAGDPKCYTKIGDSGQKRLQYFCDFCGSPIFTSGEGEAADDVGIRVGTINQRRDLSPRYQIWCSSQLSWVATIGSLPGRSGD